jgi:predicted transcriptional regulator
MSITLTVRTDEAKRKKLDKIAATADRNRNWVINEAIDNYLELHEWQMQEIEEGMTDIAAGRTHTSEEVRSHFANLKRKTS